ncbi:MAG: universal stress protein [Blastocatellia bacterium]|nr:universal stress protein [Blastocatellia bacterium]
MKILLAVDGSEYGKFAVESVAARPWPAGTVIKVLSAIEPPYLPATETWVLPETYYSQLETAGREQAQTAAREAVEMLQAKHGAQIELITEIKDGNPKDVILDEARHWGADLIVLGSHGYRGLQRFLLGSVSHTVATHAPCSVEIVRRREK